MGMTAVDREVRCRRDFSGHSAWVCMLMLGLNSEGNESVEQGRGSPSFWSWKPEHYGGEGSVQGCVGHPSSGWLMSYIALEICG